MTTNVNARGSERMRAFMAARILFNKDMMQVDCTVRNLSEGGAKLEISGAVTLPDEFDLVIPPEEPASARAPVLAPGRCLWRAFSRAVRGRERICG